jgi:hypothetical protein
MVNKSGSEAIVASAEAERKICLEQIAAFEAGMYVSCNTPGALPPVEDKSDTAARVASLKAQAERCTATIAAHSV